MLGDDGVAPGLSEFSRLLFATAALFKEVSLKDLSISVKRYMSVVPAATSAESTIDSDLIG